MNNIFTIAETPHLVAKLKGQVVVATNGCFDILHVGHLRYLESSKKLGDILVVGLNSDSSVRLLKGSNRPINSEQDRAALLAALKPVDYVVIFDDKDACKFLQAVQPNIYTKGADYANTTKWSEYQLAKDLGIKIELIDLVPDKSTTKIVEKLG